MIGSVSKEHDWTVIWSDGEHTYTHWTLAARIGQPELIDDGRDIGDAIAAAAHMSSLSASTVPALLLPVSVGTAFSTLAEISELNHDRDEYIGRNVCARIDAHHAGGAGATLWIERETCLLRRILTTCASGLGTTISYEPSLHPIDVGNIERPDVENMRPRPRKPRPWTGIGFENVSTRVDQIEPGSPASRSSLRIGDGGRSFEWTSSKPGRCRYVRGFGDHDAHVSVITIKTQATEGRGRPHRRACFPCTRR